MSKKLMLVAVSLFSFAPAAAMACACGCGVFDVGMGTMMPNGQGGSVWLEYDYVDQNKNWSGTRSSDGANNTDKEIVTNFVTASGQYMFNRSWGVQIQVPYVTRIFNTTDEETGDPASFHHASWGDVRIKGIYSGFFDDMSTGITFGVKLPTGKYQQTGLDRDTQIGTGSTDWLLGAYHQGALTKDGKFDWFVNGQWQHAFTVASHYRPGDDVNVGLGSYYNAGEMLGHDKIAPVLQLIGSARRHDSGVSSDPDNSGYTRLLISPGVEYNVNDIKLYADVEMPIYQNVNGNQLTATVLTKFIVGYSF